jgi:glycosyltransferase involved in cell wall biosynthesis
MMTALKSSLSANQTREAISISDLTGRDKTVPAWVLVAGGFHNKGGMDKANLALAQFLVEQGTPVHLVCYSVDPAFEKNDLVTVHAVRRPGGSYFLARPLLDLEGRRVARSVLRRWPGARVLVNGENCLWPGINWVHYVHHAWEPGGQSSGPFWFRVKHALNDGMVRRRERSAARIGRLFITNSNRTSLDLIERLGVEPGRVHTIYLGGEAEWGPVTPAEKTASRRSLQISETRPVAVFIGSLGLDRRKGFDTLLEAWRTLCAEPQWDVDLLVAGNGHALTPCRELVSQWNLEQRIRILGFSDRVRDLLAAADVLVSPVRYEAYGLNVQEAICRGIPAIVSAQAGVAERYGADCAQLLLADPESVNGLAETLRRWRSDMPLWKARFQTFGEELRQYSWSDMARQMVSLASQPDLPAVPLTSSKNGHK